MLKLTKKMTWAILLFMGVLQFMPFVPVHTDCQDACCQTEVSCCDMESATGCDMAMTSCSVSWFMPLVNAPLIKVQIDSADLADLILSRSHEMPIRFDRGDVITDVDLTASPPPDLTPLLI